MTTGEIRHITPLVIWRDADQVEGGYLRFDGEVAERIEEFALVRKVELGRRGAFGSVKVMASIGATTWASAVYPQRDGTWSLPVRKAIRVAEHLEDGVPVAVHLVFE